jgi:benzoate membrane transport protein
VAAFVVAGLFGELHSPAGAWVLPGLTLITPSFSVPALITIVPVVTVLVAVQGNLAATVYLRHQEYEVPERTIDISTGLSSAAISFFGTGLISMASMLAALTGGPEAGAHRLRYWSVIASGTVFILTGLLAGVVVTLGDAVPMVLLLTLAGLALISVLSQALQEITRGPLLLGPIFAFAITLSDLSILSLGSVFWALVIGTVVSVLLEGHRP